MIPVLAHGGFYRGERCGVSTLFLKKDIYKGCNGGTFGKKDQHGGKDEHNHNGCKPEFLAVF